MGAFMVRTRGEPRVIRFITGSAVIAPMPSLASRIYYSELLTSHRCPVSRQVAGKQHQGRTKQYQAQQNRSCIFHDAPPSMSVTVRVIKRFLSPGFAMKWIRRRYFITKFYNCIFYNDILSIPVRFRRAFVGRALDPTHRSSPRIPGEIPELLMP